MMKTPSIEIVSAMSSSRGIAHEGDGRALWKLPKDIRRFRDITTGTKNLMPDNPNAMAIAATTFLALRCAQYPLFDWRFNIIVGENIDCPVPFDHAQVPDIDTAVEIAAKRGSPKLFVLGGSEFYAHALSRVKRLHLTVVEGEYDTKEEFPSFENEFDMVYEEPDEENGFNYVFQEYIRK